MKIKLFAAAAAALVSAGAFAQSSVSLYGTVDTGLEWVNKMPGANPGDHSRVSMQTGNQMTGSNWGLRGVEDLGGGLKGIFNLESGFDVGTGKGDEGRLFGRKAYVGLQSQWGQVTLGRQTNLLYDFTTKYDPMALNSRYSILSQDAAMGGRADNAIKYMGTFGGLTASALYSFNNNGQEVAGNNKVGREWSAGVNYAAGPFSVGAVYDQMNGSDITTADIKVQRATVAGTYAYGPAKVFAGYRWRHATGLTTAALANDETRSNLYWLGAGYQATPALTLTGAAYYQNHKAADVGNPWLFSAGADYALSKRTAAYLNLAYAKNSSSNVLGVIGVAPDTTPVFENADGGVSSGNQMGAMVGLRHKF